jgi:tRNA-uridine 2-sulfurtransferase
VIAKDVKNNTITVGTEDDLGLYSSQCMLTDWIGSIPESGKIYGAKIRYRQEDQLCTCHCEARNNPDVSEKQKDSLIMTIQFQNPQRAITSGQICVIYDGDMIVGSGVIV